MTIKLKFKIRYFCQFILLFLIELIIALFIKIPFIRYFAGDVLVIILIYLFVRMFLVCKKIIVIIGVLLFSYFIEIGQYFDNSYCSKITG